MEIHELFTKMHLIARPYEIEIKVTGFGIMIHMFDGDCHVLERMETTHIKISRDPFILDVVRHMHRELGDIIEESNNG